MKQAVLCVVAVASCAQKVEPGGDYQYVASHVLVPATGQDQLNYGLDLTGDGVRDNAFGGVLVALGTYTGFVPKEATWSAVLDGGITVLVDLQTPSFANADLATLQLLQGSSSSIPACGSNESVTCSEANGIATCTGCGNDLSGSASFDVVPNTDTVIAGQIGSGVFEGGSAGTALSLQLALFSSTPMTLNLVDVHVAATGANANAIGDPTDPSTGIMIAGGVLESELYNTFIPGIAPLLQSAQEAQCSLPPGSDGTICYSTDGQACSAFAMFAGSACSTITPASVAASPLTAELLQPDLSLQQGSAMSFGVLLYTVGARFTLPSEVSNAGTN